MDLVKINGTRKADNSIVLYPNVEIMRQFRGRRFFSAEVIITNVQTRTKKKG